MLQTLEKEFNRLERQLDHLLTRVEPLSDAQQNFKPDAGTWSILQIFRHMMQSEGQINKYLRKKILGAGTMPKSGFLSSLRSVALNTAMRLPLRYRVPKAISVDFEEHYEFDKLSAEWRLLRREIGEFLNSIDEETSRKELFRHPSVGRMTLEQGLSFMQVHLERHTLQVERLIAHKDFPKDN